MQEIMQLVNALEHVDGGIITALVLYNLFRLNGLIKRVAYLEGRINWILNKKIIGVVRKNEKN